MILTLFSLKILSGFRRFSLCEGNAETYDLLENSRVNQGSALRKFKKKPPKNQKKNTEKAPSEFA